jgi:hypothetical protein
MDHVRRHAAARDLGGEVAGKVVEGGFARAVRTVERAGVPSEAAELTFTILPQTASIIPPPKARHNRYGPAVVDEQRLDPPLGLAVTDGTAFARTPRRRSRG